MIRSRIFIVDDHPLVREWLTLLISQTPDLEICGEAEDLNTALEAIPCSNADLAIIDLSLGGDSGFDLITKLKERSPPVTVLVLSMHEGPAYVKRAIGLGARGYIVKRESTKKIVDAIRLVLKGSTYLSEELTEGLLLGSSSGEPVIAQLSYRELEVFQFIGQGYNTREIAESLKVNIKTVQTYCIRIKEKLGLNSGSELQREALKWRAGSENLNSEISGFSA